jgi:uncharacterized protein
MSLKAFDWIALILVIVGALNWGLVGFFNFDLVYALFSSVMIIAKIVYCLVGLAGLYMVFIMAKLKR